MAVTDDQLLGIRAAAQLGMTDPMICNVVFASIGGIDTRTFRRLKHRDPRVLTALQLGMGPLQKRVSQALVNQATRGNVAAIRWLEMTRWGVREQVEVTTPEDRPFEILSLTPAQKVEKLRLVVATARDRMKKKAS